MIDFFIFVFGAIVGSFLNVCMYRLPAEESIVFPASHCGACKKPVRWHDNIPVVSYLLLRGRCRDCGTHFSAQYPVIEALTGILFVVFYHFFGLTAQGVVLLAFTLALLTQTVIDFHHKIIPDAITLPGIVLGLVASALVPQLHGSGLWLDGLWRSAVGLLVGGGFLYALAVGAEYCLKKEAMGGGDIKLLAMIGAFLGLAGVAWTLFVASVIGVVAGVYYQAVKKEEQIPFGPFLGLAAVLYIFFGDAAIGWYGQFLHRGF